jgi:hypothetical protein
MSTHETDLTTALATSTGTRFGETVKLVDWTLWRTATLAMAADVDKVTGAHFDTNAAAAAATVDPDADFIYVASYSAAVGGGGGVYERAAGEPTHEAKINSNAGSVWWELVADGIVNVQQFGATGDGSTDDATAINNAIDWAEDQNGGIVWFPAVGTAWSIASSIVMKANVMLAMSGNPGSSTMENTIRPTAAVTNAITATSITGVSFENVAIDMQDMGASARGFLITACQYLMFKQCGVKGMDTATHAGYYVTYTGTTTCRTGFFYGCYAIGSGASPGDGFMLVGNTGGSGATKYLEQIYFEGCVAEDVDTGWDIQDTNVGILLEKCRAQRCENDCIYLDDNTTAPWVMHTALIDAGEDAVAGYGINSADADGCVTEHVYYSGNLTGDGNNTIDRPDNVPAKEYAYIYTQESDAVSVSTIGTTAQTLPFSNDGPDATAVSDQANNRITLTTAGDYQIVFEISCVIVASGDSGDYEFKVALDGTPTHIAAKQALTSTSDHQSCSCSGIITATAGQQLTVEVESDNGSNTDDITIYHSSLDANYV